MSLYINSCIKIWSLLWLLISFPVISQALEKYSWESIAGLYETGAFQEVIKRLSYLSEYGDPDAQFFLGEIYYYGEYASTELSDSFQIL